MLPLIWHFQPFAAPYQGEILQKRKYNADAPENFFW